MCHEEQNGLMQWLSLAEYWYNTSFHSAIKTTPYEVLYGQPPPIHLPYLPGESKVDSVDRTLQAREEIINTLKQNLVRAQNRMKQVADKHRSERSFIVGDWVYLKLQPHRQVTVESRGNNKLAAKYFGPYMVCQKIGEVAYKLEHPQGSMIHPVFHVSLLKKHHGPPPAQATQPLISVYYSGYKVPLKVLGTRMVKRNNSATTDWLVQWSEGTADDATWESADIIEQKFPTFDPWGQGSS